MPTAKIIVKDEVNVKIEGLHLDDRKTLVKRFEYEMPGARYMPAVKLGRWSGKVSYFQLGGSTYINLLDQIIPYLEERGYDIELDDIRDYKQSFTFNSVNEQTFASHVWPTGHPKVGEPIILRDYQIEITNQFLANPQCVQEIATGAGKTLITAALSHSCEAFGRTLVIVPNKSLVTQTEEDYKNLNLDVGVYFGDRKELGRTHTIVTWQSLNNIIKNTQDGVGDITIQEFIEDVVALVIDECFDGDSKVLTPHGYIPIKDLKEGDTVINYSEVQKIFKLDTVVKQHTNLKKSINEKMYELEFECGTKIKVTGNHTFLTKSGWVRADELTENHEIITPIINTDI